jgi:hypothetical protein
MCSLGEASYPPCRGVRGGSFVPIDDTDVVLLHASSRCYGDPMLGYSYPFGHFGFRVAYVPEPATVTMLVLGGLAMLRRR